LGLPELGGAAGALRPEQPPPERLPLLAWWALGQMKSDFTIFLN